MVLDRTSKFVLVVLGGLRKLVLVGLGRLIRLMLGRFTKVVLELGSTTKLVLTELIPDCMTVLVDKDPDKVVPMIPPRQVTIPPASVEQDSEELGSKVVAGIDVADTEVPLKPKVTLAPAPAVPPTPPLAVAEAPRSIPSDPVLIAAPTLPPADAVKLAVPVAWAFKIVLLDAPFTPAPALAPIIPSPVREVTTQKLRGSPPFVQVLICALLVVIPATWDVGPFVFTDTVALIIAEIDGTDVIILPGEIDDRLRVVPVPRLGLDRDIDREVEDITGDAVFDGRFMVMVVSSTDVGSVIPVSTEVVGRVNDELDILMETCVSKAVLGKLKDVLRKLNDVLGRPRDVLDRLSDVLGRLGDVVGNESDVLGRDTLVFSEVEGTLTDVLGMDIARPVFKDVVGMLNDADSILKEVLGNVTGITVSTEVDGVMSDVDGTLTVVVGSVTDIAVFTDVVGRLKDVLGSEADRSVLMLVDGRLGDIPVLGLVNDKVVPCSDVAVSMLEVGAEIVKGVAGSDAVTLRPVVSNKIDVKLPVDNKAPVLKLVEPFKVGEAFGALPAA